jgi:hypothetical protein
VISAVPWFGLASIFDEPPPQLTETLQHATDLESSAIVTVNAWFDRPIVDRLLVGLPGRRFQWVFDKGAIFENGASHLSMVSSGASALAAESNEALVHCALTELREAVPAARTATLRRASAVRGPPPPRHGRTRRRRWAGSSWQETGSTPACRRPSSRPWCPDTPPLARRQEIKRNWILLTFCFL